MGSTRGSSRSCPLFIDTVPAKHAAAVSTHCSHNHRHYTRPHVAAAKRAFPLPHPPASGNPKHSDLRPANSVGHFRSFLFSAYFPHPHPCADNSPPWDIHLGTDPAVPAWSLPHPSVSGDQHSALFLYHYGVQLANKMSASRWHAGVTPEMNRQKPSLPHSVLSIWHLDQLFVHLLATEPVFYCALLRHAL